MRSTSRQSRGHFSIVQCADQNFICISRSDHTKCAMVANWMASIKTFKLLNECSEGSEWKREKANGMNQHFHSHRWMTSSSLSFHIYAKWEQMHRHEPWRYHISLCQYLCAPHCRWNTARLLHAQCTQPSCATNGAQGVSIRNKIHFWKRENGTKRRNTSHIHAHTDTHIFEVKQCIRYPHEWNPLDKCSTRANKTGKEK